jgi:hypothetical protein
METDTKKMTAAQRLETLENSAALTDQALSNVATNLQTVINALTLMSKKLEAVIRLGNEGKPVNSANVAAEIVEMNVQELVEKVEDLKKKGLAVATDIVQENAFIVGRELDPETREVTNRRMQFPLFSLKKEKKSLLVGKKPGDVVQLESGRNLLELLEVYSIVVPQAPEEDQDDTSSEQENKTGSDA